MAQVSNVRNNHEFVPGNPTRVKNLYNVPLLGEIVALPKNINLGWKGLSGQTLWLITNICKVWL
jgi:hypothetical protein